MVYIVSIIVVCAICVSLRYFENKRINDPHHYNSSNKSSDNLSYDEQSAVKNIQKKLVNAGYPFKIGDVYGEKTVEAVEKFQKSGKITKIPADHHMLCLRCGTTESWEKKNPVLGNGEIVFDSTKYALKVGDGKKRFTELDYIGGTHKETSDTKY